MGIESRHGFQGWRGSVRASLLHTSPVAAFEEAPVQDPSQGRSHPSAAAQPSGRGAHHLPARFDVAIPLSRNRGAGPSVLEEEIGR
jgi:hypothetical protein